MRQQIAMSFAEVLMTLEGGGSVEEIHEKLRLVTNAVRETGNAGKLTISLEIKPAGKDGGRQLIVKDNITATMPKVPKSVNLFYATDDGGLSRTNPDQLSLTGMGAS